MRPEVSRTAISEASRRIAPYIRRTPVLDVAGKDLGVAAESVVFKLEFMQQAGSFKARGAFTNLLTRAVPSAGVVAASGGNHGVAVAFAAMTLKKPAKIFVPSVAAESKRERIRGPRRSVSVCSREAATDCPEGIRTVTTASSVPSR